MGRHLNAGQALKPFPEGIICRITFPAAGECLLEDFSSGASRIPNHRIAQQLFSLRCECNLHEPSIPQAERNALGGTSASRSAPRRSAPPRRSERHPSSSEEGSSRDLLVARCFRATAAQNGRTMELKSYYFKSIMHG